MAELSSRPAKAPTPTAPVPPGSDVAGDRSPSGSRFPPGTVLADRFRIVSVLGYGGMGEVYRADDLKLGRPVALKFMPEALETDEAWLSRFYREVNIARLITHPNVCRVHDIVEADGHHFLSMEYIDGENLASLLKRVGRLSVEKATEIGLQICHGLAAAHQQDVLHRDLKPANLMIDGQGWAHITDFGLAGLADQLLSQEMRAGTPAYMAPEQLAGLKAEKRSDLYAFWTQAIY